MKSLERTFGTANYRGLAFGWMFLVLHVLAALKTRAEKGSV